MNRQPQGVVSYAGLDTATLLAGARLFFTNEEQLWPQRFASLMPLFPVELIQSMPFVGVAAVGQPVAPGGFSIDPVLYHTRLYEEMPRLYVGDNLSRNLDTEGNFHGRGVVTVDEAWTTCFPQYQPFVGERLHIYPMGGGAQAVAVPESLYPRAAGLLRSAETALGVTKRCHDYAHYVYQRIRSGQIFDAQLFETDYLQERGLTPVTIAQSDLGRMMQDMAMLKSIREGSDTDGLYTENAKRAEHILQYVPGLYACDVFEDTLHSRYNARLLQPVWEDGYVSDWWMPYQDAAAYIDRSRMTLDMGALCQGFQLAPVYDPLTRGGRYPDHIRVVVIRDREIRLRMADTLNNPAYGSGMSPQGTINKLIYIPGSSELLRQGKLTRENDRVHCENIMVAPAAYREMTALASLQETKGRLVDALYRRESVLGGVPAASPEYPQVHALMNHPVQALESVLVGRQKEQLSGYDADMDYLRRMGMEREWKPGDPKNPKTFRFAPDSLRQSSIESGFAMRSACLKYDWKDLCLPAEEQPAPQPDETSAQADVLEAPEDLHPPKPLWMDAADPCYLTTDVGGLYPTDDQIALAATLPKTRQDLLPEEEEPPRKGKKATKKKKKGKAPEFTQEELMERQILMQLPPEPPAEPQIVLSEEAPEEPRPAAKEPPTSPENEAPKAEQRQPQDDPETTADAVIEAAKEAAQKEAMAAVERAGLTIRQMHNGQLRFFPDDNEA